MLKLDSVEIDRLRAENAADPFGDCLSDGEIAELLRSPHYIGSDHYKLRLANGEINEDGSEVVKP